MHVILADTVNANIYKFQNQLYNGILCTHNDKIPHLCSFRYRRTYSAAAGQKHQLLWWIVQEVVHNASTKAWFALENKKVVY